MAPDNLKHIDPSIAPFLFGMVVKIRNFAELKGIAVAVTFLATISFSVGLFYSQTNAMMAKQDEYISKVENLSGAIVTLQRSQDITNNNVAHIRKDIDKLTAQVGEIISYKVRIRK